MQRRYNHKKLPPITKWKEEKEQLIAERDMLYRETKPFKNEIQEMEQIRPNVYDIMRAEKQRNEPIKRHDMEL